MMSLLLELSIAYARFVVGAYATDPVNAPALRLRLNLLPVAVHAEDMRAACDVAAPEFAPAAVAIGGWIVK
jgi:hypothetical protein